jgi:2'-5' RNA ligase
VADHSTVGVLIPVPEPHRERVDRYRTALAGHAPETPAHITLVPPTDVATPLASVVDHLATVSSESVSFEVAVRGTGTFRPLTPVVYLDVVTGAEGCRRLAADTGSGPLTTTARFPYHPHVTLAHHVPSRDLDVAMADWADFEAGWRVTGFRLYRLAASEWSPVRSFSLGR